mmetsp:Transcript_15816/g.49717  ORF Transcript_15816/g.49717 Transcript_15816/m.49717 type:complete len:252 (+) Transcript_15816:280-1035(+)
MTVSRSSVTARARRPRYTSASSGHGRSPPLSPDSSGCCGRISKSPEARASRPSGRARSLSYRRRRARHTRPLRGAAKGRSPTCAPRGERCPRPWDSTPCSCCARHPPAWACRRRRLCRLRRSFIWQDTYHTRGRRPPSIPQVLIYQRSSTSTPPTQYGDGRQHGSCHRVEQNLPRGARISATILLSHPCARQAGTTSKARSSGGSMSLSRGTSLQHSSHLARTRRMTQPFSSALKSSPTPGTPSTTAAGPS